jgi:hypothetical protein
MQNNEQTRDTKNSDSPHELDPNIPADFTLRYLLDQVAEEQLLEDKKGETPLNMSSPIGL